MDVNPLLYLLIAAVALGIAGYVFYTKRQVQLRLYQQYAMCHLKLSNLPKTSHTRQRLEAARRHFDNGWMELSKAKKPDECLRNFGMAVETDELGCSWRHNYEKKFQEMEIIGDIIALPMRTDDEKYYSMLTEAYLIVIFRTVLTSYDAENKDKDAVGDYQIVKNRMNVCVTLQRDNPNIYRLRADFCMRVGSLSDPQTLRAVQRDLETALRLATKDEDGRTLRCSGVDPKQQRLFVMCYCHHQLARIAHQTKDLAAAKDHFEQALKYADPDYVGLAHCYFHSCILTLMHTKKAEPEERANITVSAVAKFKEGDAAEKRVLRYLPFVKDLDLPRSLAKELIKRFTDGKEAVGDKEYLDSS